MMTNEVLADRYELQAHIARGGMADVYEAGDRLLDRMVAVKVLHSQFSSDDAFVKRFRREAQAAANLAHPNIVSIYDWGEDGTTYFIVMELINGKSLRDIIRGGGALMPRRIAEIGTEVAAALAVSHRSGLVHRDVKPGNIMITSDGTVKVTDFGIARAWDDSQELTKTGAVIGTATYFSPEQAQGAPVDERSDIYSLGVVLYEMLAGRPPFRGDSPVSVAYQHVSESALPPSTENPDVPDELDHIVMLALEKDPDHRYQSADAMRTDLLRFLQGEVPMAVPSGDAPTQVFTDLPPATVAPDEAYRYVAERRSSQIPFILTAFALLALLVGGFWALLNQLGGGVASPTLITIPELAGATQADASFELQQLGLNVLFEPVIDATVAEGLVVRTQPAAGDQVEEGAFVTLVISVGEEAFPVPLLVGATREEALQLIKDNRFLPGVITEEPNDAIPAGIVLSQNPLQGSAMTQGSEIDFVVSSGQETFALDDFAGITERDAAFRIGNLGLQLEVQTEFDDTIAEGLVIRTKPEATSIVTKGELIVVYVSDGPEPVAVPSLIGKTPQEAGSILGALGLELRVTVETIFTTDPNMVGRIIDQVPGVGAEVPPGTVVSVKLGEAPPTTTTTSPPATTTTLEK